MRSQGFALPRASFYKDAKGLCKYMVKLPQAFVRDMQAWLGSEAGDLLTSYDRPRTSGLRANGLKLPSAELLDLLGKEWKAIPWASGGFYTEEEERPGKYPHYHLGLYYIQEPSAMLPAEMLDVKPGHRVLDLCAAPGGKTTQLAAKLQGAGVLAANDNAADRAKALVKNVELSGVRNAIVMQEEPARIADAFGDWFDRVLVDAPCSGEGMFRKDEGMIRQWERREGEAYVRMQQDILAQAARLVAPGGKLVYSTCTFTPRENEGAIARFLAAHEEFAVASPRVRSECGLAPGRPDLLTAEEVGGLSEDRRASLAQAVRIWPHRCRGEGHFAVLLERAGRRGEDDSRAGPLFSQRAEAPGPGKSGRKLHDSRGGSGRVDEALRKFEAFRRETLPGWLSPGRLLVRGESVYAVPGGLPGEPGGLRTVRPGWLLGVAGKHRFEPSQALAMGLRASEASRTLQLGSADADCLRYLRGETLQPSPGTMTGKGWTLVCIDGFPAGWGRWDGATLKNERPPGWRWM